MRGVTFVRFWVSVSLAAAAFGGCSCGNHKTRVLGPEWKTGLTADPTGAADYLLDFGEVAVSSSALRKVEIENTGASPLVAVPSLPRAPFFLVPGEGEHRVEPGAIAGLEFGFAPEEATDEPLSTLIEITTNEEEGKRSYTVRLSGRGVEPKFRCEPAPVDFGITVIGNEKEQEVSCTNLTSLTIELAPLKFRGNFASSFSELQPQDRQVGPQESFSSTIRYRPTRAGSNQAILALESWDARTVAEVAIEAVAASSTLAIEPLSCLDFGYVPIGASQEQAFVFLNAGNETLQVSRFVWSDEDREVFAIHQETPFALEPGERKEVAVEFSPAAAGRRSAEFGVVATSSIGDSMTVSACATGFGGGPRLVCDEDPIDFGAVAIGIPMSRTFSCSNQGVEAPESQIDPLHLRELRSDNPLFTATIYNEDGSVGPKSEGYRVGEAFLVEVSYAPLEERFDTGQLVLEAALEGGGSQAKALSGEGRAVPSCLFSVVPPSLSFGTVDRGNQMVQRFGIINELETPCLVHQLRLTSGADPSFSVDPVDFFELGGFERMEVTVHFAPTQYQQRLEGAVEFQISSTDRPRVEVPLRGVSKKPCLIIDPKVLDFGKAKPGCQSRSATLGVSNICGVEMIIESIEVNEGFDEEEFHFLRRPSLPLTLGRNERAEFTMAYVPADLGPDVGAVAVLARAAGAAEAELQLAQLLGEGAVDEGQTDTFHQEGRPKVDILWVIDNSGSMNPYQEILERNLPSFLSYAETQLIDYQMGVTTTGLTPMGGCPGGASGGEDGRLFPVNGSATGIPRILRPETPNLEDVWRHNVKVGTCHGFEYAFEAAYRALSAPLIDSSSTGTTPWEDGNAGFLRSDAALSIIFVSDEVEQSRSFGRDIDDYLTFFRSRKGVRFQNLFKAHGIVGPPSSRPVPGCTAEEGDRFNYLIQATGGTSLSICTRVTDDQAWGSGLRRMSEGAFGFTSRFVLRGEPADVNGDGRVDEADLVVTVDGFEEPPLDANVPVWTFHPETNSIDFAPLYTPKADSQIAVHYVVACSGS